MAARSAAANEAYVCTKAYVSQPGRAVTPVDLAAGKADPLLITGSLPSSVTTTPNGRLLLVTNQGGNTLSVIDTATDTQVAKVATGLEPDAVAVSPDGTWAVVANLDDDTVTPVNLHTFRAGRPIRVGHHPDAVAIGGAHGRTAVVANAGDGTVTLVDLSSMSVSTSLGIGPGPAAVAIDQARETAVVADFGDGTVRALDLAKGVVGPAVAVGPGPTGIAVAAGSDSRHGVAWVTVGSSLVGVDLSTMTVSARWDVHHEAEAAALTTGGTTAWVAGQDGTVTAVDVATGRTSPTIVVGGRPSAIAVPPRRI